eukprot:gene10559-3078_t
MSEAKEKEENRNEINDKEPLIDEKEKDVIIDISDEKRVEEEEKASNFRVGFWLIVACISSVSMTILNKKIVVDFKFPFVLIAVQNIGSFIVTMIFQIFNREILPLKRVTLSQVYQLVLPTIGYIGLLWSSFEGLARVSVPLVIVSRNSAPLGTSLIECLFMGLKLSYEEFFSLSLILMGSIFYAFSDTTVSFEGSQWILLNLLLTVTIPIIDKKLTNDVKQEQTSTGISTLKNIMSFPMLLFIAYFKGTLNSITDVLPYLPIYDHAILFLTIFFGTTIGIAYYSLMSLVSATSVVAANVTYKLVTLTLSLIIFPVPFKLHVSLELDGILI